MAKRKRARTITMSDETFDGLKALALYRNYKGARAVSASSILEELAAAYLAQHADEVAVIQKGLSDMENQIQREISLFDDNTDSDGNTSAK